LVLIDLAANNRMRCNYNQSCNKTTMLELSVLLNEINPFAKAYRMLHDIELTELRKSQINGKICMYVLISK
jgi:hypothetical protein